MTIAVVIARSLFRGCGTCDEAIPSTHTALFDEIDTLKDGLLLTV